MKELYMMVEIAVVMRGWGGRRVKLFVFGDSYADTGNWPKDKGSSWKEPYGTTFPGKPSGRFSDGRVLTDYIGASPSPFFNLYYIYPSICQIYLSAMTPCIIQCFLIQMHASYILWYLICINF